MVSRFSEQETESYYDAEDAIYRSVWDEDGSVHWGLFDESTGNDFLKACANLNRTMVEKGRIGQDSTVLDLGCGNGTTAIWLAGQSGGRVTGIDLSGVRVANALEKRAAQAPALRERLDFEKASATDIPFPDGAFTHVWSQAVIYHVPDKRTVLSEVHRVLAEGGTIVFDDLVRPKREITPAGQTYVYDRLLFDTEFTFESYQQALKAQGFEVLEALDLSPHLKQSYLCLSERTPKDDTLDDAEHFQWLTTAYIETAAAIDRNELGWGLFICRK
jgi:ubiquinone/menaquinone biosynthesis C-methylase UbiE